jgi:predicted DNA-binding transcriptional regulator AlpA
MAERNQQVAEAAVHRADLPVHTNDALLDVPHAAAYLGMSSRWLYRNYERLPHIRIGAGKKPRIKFRRRDLDTFICQHRITPQAVE